MRGIHMVDPFKGKSSGSKSVQPVKVLSVDGLKKVLRWSLTTEAVFPRIKLCVLPLSASLRQHISIWSSFFQPLCLFISTSLSLSLSRCLCFLFLPLPTYCVRGSGDSKAGKVTTKSNSQGIRFLSEVTGKSNHILSSFNLPFLYESSLLIPLFSSTQVTEVKRMSGAAACTGLKETRYKVIYVWPCILSRSSFSSVWPSTFQVNASRRHPNLEPA